MKIKFSLVCLSSFFLFLQVIIDCCSICNLKKKCRFYPNKKKKIIIILIKGTTYIQLKKKKRVQFIILESKEGERRRIVKSRLSVLSSPLSLHPSLTSMQENKQIETLSLSLHTLFDKLIIISQRVDLYLEQKDVRKEIIGGCLCPGCFTRKRRKKRRRSGWSCEVDPRTKGGKRKRWVGERQPRRAGGGGGGSRFVKVKSKQSLRLPGR